MLSRLGRTILRVNSVSYSRIGAERPLALAFARFIRKTIFFDPVSFGTVLRRRATHPIQVAPLHPSAREVVPVHANKFMLPVYQNLALRFEKIKEAYAQANTSQEKLGLLKVAREILRQAQDLLAQAGSEMDRMKKS